VYDNGSDASTSTTETGAARPGGDDRRDQPEERDRLQEVIVSAATLPPGQYESGT
jgi:hypothetical protein